MGTFLTNNLLKRLSPADRKSLGKAGMTTDEGVRVFQHNYEKQLQSQMCQLMDQRGIFFSRSRMDKKTTIRKGMFDFTVYLPGGKFLAVETKAPNGHLSIFQQKIIKEFQDKTGEQVHIVMDLARFRQLLDEKTL